MSKAFCEKACSSGQLDGTQGAMAQGVRRHALGWSMPHHLMSTRELRVGHRCGTHQLADTANEIFLSQILAQASENMIIESNPLKKKKITSYSVLCFQICSRQMFLRLAVFVEKKENLLVVH